MPIIQVENISKVFRVSQKDPGLGGAIKAVFLPHYQNKVAVDGINFTVEPGEVVGYIGVNAARKSTTIKMLTGLLMPSGGKIRVLGRDPHRQRIANARDVGVVFGQRSQLWWEIAFIESLNMIAQLYEIDPARYKQLLDEFTEELELQNLLQVPIRNMSLGQKMRAELVATFIHEPKVVYLDEPTIGLDLIVKDRLREFIKRQNRERGMTVILTTHDLGDITELCVRVIIIDAGQLIFDGPLSKIKDRFGKHREISFEMARSPGTLKLPPGTEILAAEKFGLRLRFDRTLTTASQVAGTVMSQAEVIDFSILEPDLSSIVKQIYNGALNS